MRKLLNSLYILDEKAYLSLDGENIVCKLEDNEKFRLPFSNIEDIYCFNYMGCSPALMGKCVEYGVSLSFISPQGKYLASVKGETKGNVYLRKAQFELFSKDVTLLIQNTVAAKLANTRFLIKRSMRDNLHLNDDQEVIDCLRHLSDGIENVYKITDKEIIMGIEGNCAKSYFNIFNKLILKQKEDFSMYSRTKRPPLDRVNAVLSFLYTIVTRWCASALGSVGLDSYMGFYHALRPGRSSLACDMVEEFRCIVERLVLSMINLKIINSSHFETQPSGAIYLNGDGKKKVLSQWQEKKRTIIQHPYLKQKMPLGLLPFVQSSLLAKYIRGEIDEYPCYLSK
ncbi:MAG: type I-C CRISPR-associated endonuclease Cas1 [Clostridiales bacterium]|nr:type I-C CRISPR-associated endonuclease Cas1 [Clostridiales bacterium]